MIRESGTSKRPDSDNRKPANRSGVTLAKTRAKGDPKKPREVLAGKPLFLTPQRNGDVMQIVKVLGVNDDVTTCECCGRTGLKKTVVLDVEGSQLHYGTQCAAKKLRFGMGAKYSAHKIESVVKTFKGVVWTV